ncbi:choice-of-anchor D domain-containing protein [Epibacterium sp. DP7N7-1]|nr:choice-of-anchor D domain-containing protein [Epibacterium sp. DP7N7-1]
MVEFGNESAVRIGRCTVTPLVSGCAISRRESGWGPMRRRLSGVLLFLLLSLFLVPQAAEASFTDCPANTSPGNPLTMNLTEDECTLETGAAGSALSDDLIQIQIVSGSSTNFFIFDPSANDTRDLVFNVNNGSDQGTLDADGGSLTGIDCAAGCTVSGTHGGTPFSFNYTASGGGGSLDGAPEIDDLSSSTGNTVADGGTDTIATAINSGTATTITYDVSNSGSETLTLSGLTLGTPTNASFGSTSIDTASVASGGTENDAISITFTPSSTTDGATFTVPFSFTTNDADDGTDETTFNVTISGTINAEAEISDLTSSTTNTVADGGSDAQGTVASGSAQTLTYTITNTGTADLTVATPISSGASNVTVNSISAPGSTTVAAAGGTTQFNVQYTPTAAGAFSFGLSFVNSDADEDPFNFTISGTATQAPGFSQAIAPGTILADGTATVTFTIDNSANATAATALDVTNTLPAGVEVAATPNASTTCTGGTLTASGGGSTISYTGGTVSAGASCSVQADVTAASDGSYSNTSGDLTSSLGNSGTSSAPLTVASPEIDLQRPAATSLADGGTDAQGSVAVGVQQVLTYTVENTGTATLTLSGTPSSTAASNVSVDSISAPGTSSLAASASTTFTVAYTPTAAGAFSFELDVDSDDADEGTYDLTISGTATQAPGFSQAIAPGTILADGTATVTFTIDNSANATAATALDFSNTLPAGVEVAATPNASTTCTGGTLTASGGGSTISYTGGTVSAGASCSVQADVTAASDGSYSNTSGDLTSSLGNSGTSSAPLTVASPEIDLQRPAATSLADGGTDAQGSVAVGVQQVLTYTVENTGTATLSLSGTPSSTAASNVSVDSISAPGTSSLAASASTTFTVAYTPTAAGAFSFELDVDSDDADEGTYDLTISGTATGSAEIGVGSSSGGNLEDGDTDTIPGTPSAGSANVITYTFTNSGSDTLNITTPTVAGNISNETNVVVNGLTLASNTVASGGGTTTLEISYTPQASGAYSFDLQVANTDADESLFNITVAGAASGTPEIEVSSSVSGALSDGGTDSIAGAITPGTATSVTYTITNSGTDVLALDVPSVASSISNQNNVTVDSLSLAATSVASGGGTTTLQVDYTAIAGGAYGFDLSLGSDDADEDPFDISVTGTAQSVASGLSIQSGSGQVAEVGAPFAAPLVARVTDSGGAGVAGVDVTFAAPASGASVVFANTGTRTETVTTGSDGTATSSAMTANDTASSYAGGSTLTSYDVSASATGLSSVNFALTNDRDAEADIQKTQEVIAAFVSNRANTIVSNQPDLVSRLTQGGLKRQQGRNGFGLRATSNRRSATFRFSLRALLEEARRRNDGSRWRESLRTAAAGAEAAAEDAIAARSPALRFSATEPAGSETTEAPVFAPVIASGWDFWAEGTYAVTESGNFESRSGLFFAGVDYRWSDKVVLGVMGQLDITDEDNSAAGTSASGTGWMAGPYVVVRLDQNLYLDVAATYGQSSNTVNALGLFEDDFNTERFLLQGGLTGDFKLDARTTISPFARLIYYYEKQESYTDTLGRVIPSQEFDLGRFEFGPRVSWQLALDRNTQFSPYLSFSGIYDFNKLQGTNPTDATLASSQSDFRGRLEAGATFIVPDRGIKIAFEGFYDGIGASDFESYGASLNIHIPF